MNESKTTCVLDKAAAFFGVWALRRLYGCECSEFCEGCISCEAQKLVEDMEEILHD